MNSPSISKIFLKQKRSPFQLVNKFVTKPSARRKEGKKGLNSPLNANLFWREGN